MYDLYSIHLMKITTKIDEEKNTVMRPNQL